jgi:AraC-like DNA-binding protein
LFRKIEEYIKEGDPEASLLIKITFLKILTKLNALFKEKKGTIFTPIHDDERVTKLLEYIHKNLEQKITLEKLSQQFNINKFHLCRIFKKGTGFTVNEYLTNKRIIRIKDYLLKGLPVIESCYRVGFSDYSNFYRIFKRATGITPKQFECFYFVWFDIKH